MALRVDARRDPPDQGEARAGSERDEQPADSDRKAKSQRRKARTDRSF